jgi:hypothetical protein
VSPLEYAGIIVTIVAGIALVEWLVGRRPTQSPPPIVQQDDRPTMTEFTSALAALERSQQSALEAITSESEAARSHVEAIVTQLTGPATPASPDSAVEPEPDNEPIVPGREASDEWISDDELVDPFAPPPGVVLPPMPGVMPPDGL